MSQIINHPSVDVVVLGMGVMSGTVAAEVAKAGYKVVGLERGPHWDFATDFFSPNTMSGESALCANSTSTLL